MNQHDREREQRRQVISALMDGQGTEQDQQAMQAWWACDEAVRADWHGYHLIGDVMRSSELAPALGTDGDEKLLQAVRERLKHEPAVLAPAASAALKGSSAAVRPLRRPRIWMGSAAAAAGFLVVGAAYVLTRSGGEPALTSGVIQQAYNGASPSAASTTSAHAAIFPTAATNPGASGVASPHSAALVTGARLIRDEQLDRYLAAHKQFASPVMPGGVIRSATTLAPEER